MKKKPIAIVGAVIAVVICVVAAIMIFCSGRVVLDQEYYGHGEIGNISIDQMRSMIDEKKSFVVFVSQPDCRTADKLREILQDFITKYPMQIFEVSFSDLKSSGLADEVKYYPSVIIYRDGKIADFLDANDGEDSAAYNSLEGFEEWFTNQVILKE